MSLELVSAGTAVTASIGVVVAYFYLAQMGRALARAVRTREQVDRGEDRYRFGFVGAVVAVAGSASAIAAYGAGPALLYLGPALAVASSVAVAYCLRQEATES